jgi:hypothetical protein
VSIWKHCSRCETDIDEVCCLHAESFSEIQHNGQLSKLSYKLVDCVERTRTFPAAYSCIFLLVIESLALVYHNVGSSPLSASGKKHPVKE